MDEFKENWPESFGQIISGEGSGNLGAFESFWNDLTGLTSQQREFAQQNYLLEKQQVFSRDYKSQLAAMEEAGINPLTAAGAVAGSAGAAGPSAPQVSSNNQGFQGAINSLAGAAGVAGDVVEKFSSANERNTLLDERKKQIVSDTFLKYKEAGYNDEMAKGLSIANAYMPSEKFLGIVSLSQQIDNARGEYQVMMQGIEESKARISEIDKHIEEMGSTISLNEKFSLESEKRTLQIEAQTTELNWLNNKRKELGIDPHSPIENNLFMLGVKGDAGYKKALQISTDIAFSSASGSYIADPYNEEYRKMYDYRNELMDRLSDCREILAEANQKLKSGELSNNDYNKVYNEIRSQMKSLHQEIDEADDNWHDMDYTQGHTRMWQDLLNSLLPFGLGAVSVGLGRIGKGPKKIKGLRR